MEVITLVFKRPFWKPEKFFEDFFDDLFPELAAPKNQYYYRPSLNIIEFPDRFEYILDTPGFDKKDIEITIDENIMRITSNKDFSENYNYIYKERVYSNFDREIDIPNGVDTDDIKAVLKKGILKIILRKLEPEIVKKIEIEDENDTIDITDSAKIKN